MNDNHILLGLKRKESSGSYYGSEGFESFSMEGTEITILKEGTIDELKKYVEQKRKLGKTSLKKLAELEDRVEQGDMTLTEEDYDNELEIRRKEMTILKFDKLLIVNGITI